MNNQQGNRNSSWGYVCIILIVGLLAMATLPTSVIADGNGGGGEPPVVTDTIPPPPGGGSSSIPQEEPEIPIEIVIVTKIIEIVY